MERLERAVLDSRAGIASATAPGPRSPLESLIPRYQGLQDPRYSAPSGYPFSSAGQSAATTSQSNLALLESSRYPLLSPTGLYPPNTLAPAGSSYLPTSPVRPSSLLYYPSATSSSVTAAAAASSTSSAPTSSPSSSQYQYLHTTSEGRTLELLGASSSSSSSSASSAVPPPPPTSVPPTAPPSSTRGAAVPPPLTQMPPRADTKEHKTSPPRPEDPVWRPY